MPAIGARDVCLKCQPEGDGYLSGKLRYTFPMQGYELVCITQDSDKREDTNEYVWEISEGLQTCQYLSA